MSDTSPTELMRKSRETDHTANELLKAGLANMKKKWPVAAS